jgi:hypothetical protein
VNVPAGNIAATNVQAAIAELDAEKQPLDTQLTTIAGLTMTGNGGKALLVNSGGTDFELGTVATDLTNISTNVKLTTIGNGLYIAEGTNATMGVATLVAGSKVVSTTKVTANSRIFTSIQSLGTVTVPKGIGVTARTAGTSFTLTSADATDTSVLAWMIVEPASVYPSALLHFNGSDAATTFTDESGKAWTAAGNAQIDTAQSQFGGASGLFDGTGDYISAPNSTDFNFGTGDFTIEWFQRWNSLSGYQTLYDYGYVTAGALTIQSGNGTGGYITYIGGSAIITEGSNASTATWYHYALVKDSGTLRMYRAGVQTASAANATSITNSAALGIGAKISDGTVAINGWLDELRITKGVCRYPSGTTFTPPSAEFTYP